MGLSIGITYMVLYMQLSYVCIYMYGCVTQCLKCSSIHGNRMKEAKSEEKTSTLVNKTIYTQGNLDI